GLRRLLDHFELHLGDSTFLRDAEGIGGRRREVDAAALHVRTAIVDAHHDRIAGLHVGDADVGAEWQAAVRGRHGVVVELLAARRRGVVHVEAGDAVEGVFLVFPDADGLFRLPGLAAVAQRRLVLVGAVALHASNYVIGFDNEVAGHNRRRAGRRIMAVTHGRGARA